MTWLGARWRRLVRAKWAPSLATVLVTVGATVTTAMLGLVLEEYFPTSATEPTFTGWRVVVLFLSAALLFLGLRIATARSRGFGTFFYVRLLPENTPDWHYATVDRAEEQAMDFRSATGWFGRRDPSVALDLRREVAQLCIEIERATNDDVHNTGLTLAPNVAFPTGLFVGWNWEPILDATLEDFNRETTPKPRRWPRDRSWLQHSAMLRRDQTVASGFRFQVEAEDTNHDQPLRDSNEVRSHDCANSMRNANDVRSVWLHLHLTQFGAESPTHVFRRIPQAAGVDVQRLVAAFRGNEVLPVIAHGDDWDEIEDPDVHDMHCRDLGETIAYWIRQTLVDYPNAVIVLSARVTKTAQLVAGWYLATRDLPMKDGRSAAAYPWQRIVPMWFDEGVHPPVFRPVWAYHDQIDPDLLLCRAGVTKSGE